MKHSWHCMPRHHSNKVLRPLRTAHLETCALHLLLCTLCCTDILFRAHVCQQQVASVRMWTQTHSAPRRNPSALNSVLRTRTEREHYYKLLSIFFDIFMFHFRTVFVDWSRQNYLCDPTSSNFGFSHNIFTELGCRWTIRIFHFRYVLHLVSYLFLYVREYRIYDYRFVHSECYIFYCTYLHGCLYAKMPMNLRDPPLPWRICKTLHCRGEVSRHRRINEILGTVFCSRFNKEHPVEGLSRISKDILAKHTQLNNIIPNTNTLVNPLPSPSNFVFKDIYML